MRVLANALLIAAISVLLGFGPMATQEETASSLQEWSFDHEQPGIPPSQFSIGTMFDGRAADHWQVLATDQTKSSQHVLAQSMSKGAEHAYNVALIKAVIADNLNLKVSFLPVQGQAGLRSL
jgi:hypothetical protein